MANDDDAIAERSQQLADLSRGLALSAAGSHGGYGNNRLRAVEHGLPAAESDEVFGVEEAVTAAATVALTAGAYNLVTCTLNQDVTFNITGGHTGQEITFILTQDATGDRAVTFGTSFESEGVYSATASERIVVSFFYNGSKWIEKSVSGNAVLPETRSGLILSPSIVQAATNEIPIWKAVPADITIIRLEITLDSASYDVAGDLKKADAVIGYANSSVINPFDTTSGVLI